MSDGTRWKAETTWIRQLTHWNQTPDQNQYQLQSCRPLQRCTALSPYCSHMQRMYYISYGLLHPRGGSTRLGGHGILIGESGRERMAPVDAQKSMGGADLTREWAIIVPCYLMFIVLLTYWTYAGLTSCFTEPFDSMALITGECCNGHGEGWDGDCIE